MNAQKFGAILRTIMVLNALKGEKGSYRLGEISQWASMPRATCDRQLRMMVACNILVVCEKKYKGDFCRVFSISEAGEKLAEILKL